MTKLFLLPLLLLQCAVLEAQPWMPTSNQGERNFSKITESYYRQFSQPVLTGIEDRQRRDAMFDRWDWYWRQHLDPDGNIVPTSKTRDAWDAYTTGRAANKQLAKTTSSLPSDWIFKGPRTSPGGYSGLGRINVVAFDPVDSNVFYAGSAAGSTWKTTNGGLTWSSLYDNLPTLGVSDIKVNPLNGNTIFVATGDAEAGDAYSSGIILSHDGGATWMTTSLTWLPTSNYFIRSLIINPLDTNKLMAATNIGIFKSFDAGMTWTNVAPGNFLQVLYKPGDSNIVYGTVYTDSSAQILRSVNGGLTWAAATHFNDAQRINIAVCPSSPAVVKAVASNSASGLKGIYSSNDNGATYTATYTEDVSCSHELLGFDMGLPTYSCGGKAWYAMCIAMNPLNANQVTVGGINTYYSSDGGASWQIANGWYDDMSGLPVVHANKHCLAYSPTGAGLYETCDGGIYRNYGSPTGSWTDLSNGICVTQFYRTAVNNDVPFCLGGAQDNGSKMLNGGTATDLAGGNGTQPLINYGDPANVFYCSSQYGYTLMTRDAGAHFHSISDALMTGGGFISPYVIHPTDTATLYLAYKRVYVTHDNGVTWSNYSPVFDTGAYLKRLAISQRNPAVMYTVLDKANGTRSLVAYTINTGVTWDTVHVPYTNFISDLAIDPRNEQHIWVTVGGYGAGKVYSYNLATNIWTNESGSLPDLPANCMAVDTESRTRYVGTDAAVFYKDTLMSDWALYNNHLPTAHVYDIQINYSTGDVWAATYGRGMWKTNRADNPGTLAIARLTDAGLVVYPNPAHGTLTLVTANTALCGAIATVKLIAGDGRVLLYSKQVWTSAGRITLDVQQLPAGFYICEVSGNGAVMRTNVVIN